MNILHKIKRPTYLIVSGIMATAAVVPALVGQTANAYGLVGTRSIQLSSSKQADTDVNYKVSFTTATTSNLGGIVVEFCDNSPIIGDSCSTGGTSLNINKATLAVSAVSATLSGAGFALDTANSTATRFIYTTATPASSVASSTALTFTLGGAGASDGVTNPNTSNTSFYGRIVTYATAAGATGYTSANVNAGAAATDAGGIAMSTDNQITVTSKVQERLTFCVYTGANCAAGGSAISLGDTNGVLDPAGPYVDKNTKYDIATNASQGAAIRIKGDTLKSGAFSINAAGASAAASAAGTEQFGFCTYQTAGTTITPAPPYNDAGCSGTTQSAGTATPGGAAGANFALDTASTNTTYGQTFANAVAGASSTGDIAFLGNIANTTEAAIYQTTLTFIATGVY